MTPRKYSTINKTWRGMDGWNHHQTSHHVIHREKEVYKSMIMYASSNCQYIKTLVTMTQQLWCKYRAIVMFQGQLIAEKEFQWAQFSSPLCMISSSSIFHLQRNEFFSHGYVVSESSSSSSIFAAITKHLT